MYPLNWLIVFSTALIPIVIGFVWFHPKVFGTVWAKVSGTDEEKMKNSNMLVILLLSLLFSAMLAITITTMSVHQMHVYSMVMDNNDVSTPGTETHSIITNLMAKYGQNFRTFKHGVLHGVIASIFFVLPVMGITSLFERRGAKYLFVHWGYWALALGLMGGVISGFA